MSAPAVALAPRPSKFWWCAQYVGELIFFGLVLFCLAEFGLSFAQISPQVTPVMPAAGIALAIFLWRGYRLWPAAWITGVISRYLLVRHLGDPINYHDLAESCWFAAGGTTTAIGGVWLVEHFVGRRVDFGSIKGVLGFIWWGGVVRSVLVATWAVGYLVWTGRIDPSQTQLAWINWFAGSAMGSAVFGSFILTWVQPSSAREGEASTKETLLVFGLLALVTWADFTSELPLTFLPFPLLVWAGLRMDPRALTTSIVIVVVTALGCTKAGLHPFGLANVDPDELLIIMQGFIVCAAGTGMVLGAVASDRRRTLRATAELASFRKGMLDGSNFSIILCDDQGIIRSVNRGTQRLLGYREDELLGHTPAMYHDPAEVAARAQELSAQSRCAIEGFETFVHVARQGAPEEREWTYIRKDGSRVPVYLSVTRLDPSGPAPGFLGVAVDITARRQAEEQMRAARAAAEQANRAKSEFLANISHEIRTPMNSILGFAELLHRHVQNPGMKKQAQSIVSSGQTLLQLINDLLDLSKVEAGRLEIHPAPVNLRALMAEMRQFFTLKTDEKRLVLKLEFHGPVDGQFKLDEVRVRQILFNLVGNAIKFTERGQIVLSATAEEESPGLSRLHLDVRDTGIGIPSEELARIFLPFEQRSGQSTRKYGGTGLGLSISRRLAELMGGTLLASSETGLGSTFRLTIPHLEHLDAPAPTPVTEPPMPAEWHRAPALVTDRSGECPTFTPETQAAWQRCAELAAGPWMESWRNLLRAPLFDEVEQFALTLAEAAGDDTPQFLRDYAQRLAEQARDFEVEEMAQSLREFPELAMRLKREAALAGTAPANAD
jgi:PAS domain S-box-containing protein